MTSKIGNIINRMNTCISSLRNRFKRSAKDSDSNSSNQTSTRVSFENPTGASPVMLSPRPNRNDRLYPEDVIERAAHAHWSIDSTFWSVVSIEHEESGNTFFSRDTVQRAIDRNNEAVDHIEITVTYDEAHNYEPITARLQRRVDPEIEGMVWTSFAVGTHSFGTLDRYATVKEPSEKVNWKKEGF